MTSNRRDFLKTGAAVAAPAALLAAPALAAAAAPLPQRETGADKAAVEALLRDAVRRFNAGGAAACSALSCRAGAIALPADARAIRLPGEVDPEVTFDDAGATAQWSARAMLVRETRFAGDSTIERMARFQGQGAARSETPGTLAARLARAGDGWTIIALAFA